MKQALLIRSVLQGYFERGRRTLPVLILVSLACAYFTLFVGMGALAYRLHAMSGGSSYANVSLVLTGPASPDTVGAFLQEEPLGAAANALLMDLNERENGAVIIGWKGTLFGRWHALEAGKSFFTEEQAQSNELIAIRGAGFSQAPQATLRLGGAEYQVVQEMPLIFFMFAKNMEIQTAGRNPDVVILPYRTFLEQGFRTDVLRVDLARPLVGSERAVKETVSKWFPGAQIVLPPAAAADIRVQADQQRNQAIFLCMCALALANVMILYNQLLRRAKKQCAVFSFCGASRAALVCSLIGAWTVCNFIAAVAAYTGYALMRPLWAALGIQALLPAGQGAAVFLIAAALASAVSLAPTMRMCSMNIRPRGGIT